MHVALSIFSAESDIAMCNYSCQNQLNFFGSADQLTLHDISVAPNEICVCDAYSAFGPFDQLVVSTRHKYLPNIDLTPMQARTPSVCRVVVTMMGKLHLQIIRDVDICIRLYIE